MLEDILEFASHTLVDHGRLCMWMPTANDEDIETAIPRHSHLELVSVCVQKFSKCKPCELSSLIVLTQTPGSRRLLTYSRLPDREVGVAEVKPARKVENGRNADDLNKFRRKFFEGFKEWHEMKRVAKQLPQSSE
jgi:tRNA (guanine10-N2)-methyltransferase